MLQVSSALVQKEMGWYCCSAREVERGDREVWGTVSQNQIGILHPGTLPVKYEYDTVLDEACTNEQVQRPNSNACLISGSSNRRCIRSILAVNLCSFHIC